MNRWAYDYLTKPFSLGQIDVLLQSVRVVWRWRKKTGR
jgi:DNA-binding response OmpR family regulator